MTIDHSGNAEYAAHFEQTSWLRVIAIVCFVMLLASLSVNLWQWRQPPRVYGFRVDEVGRAQAIPLNGTNYTPREVEIVSALTQWATDRFRLIKPFIPVNFKQNYFFLDERLAKPLAVSDPEIVAKIQAGTLGEQDVKVNGVSFRAFDAIHRPDGTVGSGEAVIDMYKIYNTTGPFAKEHWLLTARYEVNPAAAAQQDQAYQVANPLGVRIVWFHEDKVAN
jgi:hypothetical protein